MRRRLAISVLTAVAMLAGACGDDAESSSTTTTSPSSTAAPTTTAEVVTSTMAPTTSTTAAEAAPGVELVAYPFWDNDVAVAAPDALDELAAEYLASFGADEEPEMERFLFGDLAVDVFDEVFEGTTPERRQELMWMMWVSGYFGGRWLRGEIADAQPNAPLVGFSQTPTEESFGGTMGRAADRLSSLEGDDAAIIDAARAALFDRPPAQEGGDPIAGLADNFGYNRGYLEEILNTPPEGVDASPQFQVDCAGLFDCTYTTPKLAVLAELAGFQALLNGDEPPDPALVAELLPVQADAIPRGVSVWSGGLSVQGFSQESYDQLLDVSSSFLETVQAAALINTRAVAEDDVAAAQTGLVAEAVMIVWLEAYRAGLTNGDGVIELPSFS
jgi:hypothetical protein